MNLKNWRNPLISGTVILTLTGLLSRLIGFFYRIFLSNVFGAEGMGIYQLISPVLALTFALTVSGIQTAISKYVAAETATRDYKSSFRTLWAGFLLAMALSVVCAACIYLRADYIAAAFLLERRTAPLLRIIALSIPMATVHSCINGYFYGIRKTAVPAISQLAEQLCRVGSENGQTGGFIGGSKTKDGKAAADTDTDMVNLEISANMLPVKGTLGSLVKQGGTFSKSKAGSVFTVLGDVVDVEELRNAGGEDVNGFKRVSEIFEKYGGIPNYLQMYTFFGQIYDGWETVDKILGTSIVDEGVPDDEDKNLQPVTEIKFTQVYMSTYGEQKENGYTIPEKGEKSGSESDKE